MSAAEACAGRVSLEDALPDSHEWPLRVRLAVVAAWEISALAELLLKEQGDDFSEEDRAARRVLFQIRKLAAATMSAVSDEFDPPGDIRDRAFPDQEADFANVRGAT